MPFLQTFPYKLERNLQTVEQKAVSVKENSFATSKLVCGKMLFSDGIKHFLLFSKLHEICVTITHSHL